MSTLNKRRLLVIIPAFNEAGTILEIVSRIPASVKAFADYRILVVDDGSSDGTAQKVAGRSDVEVLSWPENRGVGAAMKAALDYAIRSGYDLAASLDADGQFDPAEIPRLIGPIMDNEADLVVGNRFNAGRPAGMPAIKYSGNRLMNALIGLLVGRKCQDVSCGFRAYSREAMLRLNLFGRFTYTQEMFLELNAKGLAVAQVPVSVKYFAGRRSRVAGNLLAYAAKAFVIIFRAMVYYRPLRFFGTLSLGALLSGAAMIAYLFAHKLATGAYTPYKALGFMGGSALFLSTVLFFFGLLADMLDRIRRTLEESLYRQRASDRRDRDVKS